MKKLAVLLLAMFVAGGVVMAQVPGLSVGGEIGIMDFEDLGDNLIIRPMVIYENGDLAPGLDLYLEAGVPLGMVNSDLWLGLDLNIRADYGLELAPGSKLGFFLENVTYLPLVEDILASTKSPDPSMPFGISYKISSWLMLGARYTHTLDFGDIYGQLELPFILVHEIFDPFKIVDLNITAGVDMPAGFGGSLTIYNEINNGFDDSQFFAAIGLAGYYAQDQLYAGLGIYIPTVEDGVKNMGISLFPEVRYEVMDNLQIYGKLPIQRLFNDIKADIEVGLVIGVKYSL